LTKEGIALGEKLFFDKQLSKNGNISCASCHIPSLSFSDGKQFSIGHSGKSLLRHTPTLINLAWSEEFFWDGGVKNLESISFAALLSDDEMNVDLSLLISNLNGDKIYRDMFKTAFKTDAISSAYITRGLAQYMRTLIYASSKYDSVMQNQTTFSEKELLGFEIFKKNCTSCHTPPLFTDNLFHNNNIPQSYSMEHLAISTGRYRITLDSADFGKVKTPTLRNITTTAPYMHNGSIETLDKVLTHYRNQPFTKNKKDPLLQQINFTIEEQAHIISFLSTLKTEFNKKLISE
jgi:cytochrome c peroxidase